MELGIGEMLEHDMGAQLLVAQDGTVLGDFPEQAGVEPLVGGDGIGGRVPPGERAELSPDCFGTTGPAHRAERGRPDQDVRRAMSAWSRASEQVSGVKPLGRTSAVL